METVGTNYPKMPQTTPKQAIPSSLRTSRPGKDDADRCCARQADDGDHTVLINERNGLAVDVRALRTQRPSGDMIQLPAYRSRVIDRLFAWWRKHQTNPRATR